VREGGAATDAGATTISVDEARNHGRRLRNGVAALVVLVILVGSLLLAVPGLHGVVKRFEHVNPAWLGLALVLELLSGFGYVLVFQLVFSRVQRAFASRLAWAEMAFGAAGPAGGMGSIAIGAWVLCSRGMPRARIVERSGVLFLLTSAVNAAVLAFFGLGLWVGIFSGPRQPLLSLVPGAAAIGGLAFFLALPRWAPRATHRRGVRGRIVGSLLGLADIVRATREALLVRDWRLIGAFGYLLLDIAVLWVCFAAIGAVPPVASLVLAYQIGYLASLVPTRWRRRARRGPDRHARALRRQCELRYRSCPHLPRDRPLGANPGRDARIPPRAAQDRAAAHARAASGPTSPRWEMIPQ
jgi:uncharacterized membrane protein YbhN (UPF0104 family)